MADKRLIAADAIFMVLYIGLLAAVAVLSIVLLSLLAIGTEPALPMLVAALASVVLSLVLPLAPRLYARITGRSFSWRENAVFDGVAEG